MLINLYKSLVRPIIEYGNTIWGPYYILDQQSIEKIQRRATRLLTGLYDTPYSERLAILGLPSLQYRRFRNDMKLLYRLAHSDIAVNFFDYFSYPTYTYTRGHHFKLTKPYTTTRARLNFLPQEQLMLGTVCHIL